MVSVYIPTRHREMCCTAAAESLQQQQNQWQLLGDPSPHAHQQALQAAAAAAQPTLATQPKNSLVHKAGIHRCDVVVV
jgi:hypothetical protein